MSKDAPLLDLATAEKQAEATKPKVRKPRGPRAPKVHAEPEKKAEPAPAAAKPKRERKPAQAKAVAVQQAPSTGTAVAVAEPAAPPVPRTMLDVIYQAACNPVVDVEKMRALLDMQEHVMARDAKAEYEAAFVEMQGNLPIVTKKGVIEVKEKTATGQRDGRITQSTPFAKWEDINRVLKPILHAYGFNLKFATETAPDGKLRIIGKLAHKNGHFESTYLDLMHDSTGSKNGVQAVGSSFSYGRRYCATGLLNLTFEGEDDDGMKGGGTGPIDDVQRAELMRLLDDAGLPIDRFCHGLDIDGVALLPSKRYDEAKERIAQFKKQKARA